jgi:NAD+ diphosphatase
MDFERDRHNFYAGPYLDRRAELRESATWLDEARADPRTRYLLARGTAHLLTAQDSPDIAFLDGDHPVVSAAGEERLVLLGWFGDARVVLVEMPEDAAEPLADTRFEELRPLSSRLPAKPAGLLSYARALTIWRSRHRFCGTCGSPARPTRAGHVMQCTNASCGSEMFPRIDPAIIVLVTHEDRALLGRQPSWPKGRFSTIAGFVEPGESLEDAVAREVLEETGVKVRSVDYHSSQPWPFPSSIMVGFLAEAATDPEIRVTGELDEARWFTREEVANGQSLLPPPHSISFRLIAQWFDAGWPEPLEAAIARSKG